MIRTLLFLILGYMIWSIGRAFWRIWLRGHETRGGYGTVHGQKSRPRDVEKPFAEIEDAEFEELDSDKKKDS